MRSVILSFILIFALQSQASFLSRTFYNSVIYKSCFGGSLPSIPLDIGHNTVETVNNETLSPVSSTSVNERDNHQIESGSGQASEVTRTPSTDTSSEAFKERVMSILRRDVRANVHKKTTSRRDRRGNTSLNKSRQTNFIKDIILILTSAPSHLILPKNEPDSTNELDESHLLVETTNIMSDPIHENNNDSCPSKETTDITSMNNPGKDDPPGHSRTRLIRTRTQTFKPKNSTLILQDLNNDVEDVHPVDTSVQSPEISQEQLVSPVNDQLKCLIDRGKYDEIAKLGESMDEDEFLKKLCPVVKTPEQYNGIVDYLKRHEMVPSFYVHGDIAVVKGAIVKTYMHYRKDYVDDGDLESALPLALKEDNHDCVIDLLKTRQEVTAEKDIRTKFMGIPSSFECFMYSFLENLTPWEKYKTELKRFLTLHGDELRKRHHDILDTLCQRLVDCLNDHLDEPEVEKLLVDLIGQPSLLTPMPFAKGFLYYASCGDRSKFIKYGWREVVQKGLMGEYWGGGEELWQVMKEDYPDQFTGEYPSTADALAAVLTHFPTKRQKEMQWLMDNASNFLETIMQAFADIIPDGLISIVIEYERPTWLDV